MATPIEKQIEEFSKKLDELKVTQKQQQEKQQNEIVNSTPFKSEIVDTINSVPINRNLLQTSWIKDWTNICVAGGHVVNAIMNDSLSSRNGDIDIFLISPNTLDKSYIKKLITKLFGMLSIYYNENTIFVCRFYGTISFIVKNVFTDDLGKKDLTIQIVYFKVAKSIADCISKFDLNNCQFALVDEKVYMTSEAKKYLETKEIYNYIDRSMNPVEAASRNRRVEKYRQRTYNKIVTVEKPKEKITSNWQYPSANKITTKSYGTDLYAALDELFD